MVVVGIVDDLKLVYFGPRERSCKLMVTDVVNPPVSWCFFTFVFVVCGCWLDVVDIGVSWKIGGEVTAQRPMCGSKTSHFP